MAFSEPKPFEGIINNRQQFKPERFKLMVESVVYERRESVLRVCRKIEKFKQQAGNKAVQTGLLELQIKHYISKQGISQQQNKKVLKTMEISKKKLISDEERRYINCLEEVFMFTCQTLNYDKQFNSVPFNNELEKLNTIVLEMSQQQLEEFNIEDNEPKKQEMLLINLIRGLINQQQTLFSQINDQKLKELYLEDKKPQSKDNIIVHITSMHKADQLAREIFDGLDKQFVLYRGKNKRGKEADLLDVTLKAQGVQLKPNHIYTQILGDWNKVYQLQDLQRLIDAGRINYQMITASLKLDRNPKLDKNQNLDPKVALNSIVNLLDDCADMDKWIKIISRYMKDLNETQAIYKNDQGVKLYFEEFYKSKLESIIKEYTYDQKNGSFLPSKFWDIREEGQPKGSEIKESDFKKYLERKEQNKEQEITQQSETKFNDILFEFCDGAIYFYSEYDLRLLVQFHSLQPKIYQEKKNFTLGQYLYDEEYWNSIIRLRFHFVDIVRNAQPQVKPIQQQLNQEEQNKTFKNLIDFCQNINEQNKQDKQRRDEIYGWILKCLVVISRKIIKRDKQELKKHFERNKSIKDVDIYSNHSKQFEIKDFQN